ncbi:MAG: helix-turn-helix transcriptional regulator [Mycolicibacterium sp.]|nr:helix-turn-helix transcriptional regulator [Mycolicibacterium sp.]
MKTAARPRDAPDLDALPDGTEALDEIFGALADPTRRAIVTRLTEGPCSVSELAAPFPISAPAITKHLSVLERAGMIARWKTGRVNYCRLVGDPLGRAGAWIEQHHTFWERQLDALENYLDRETETCNQSPPTPQD